MVILLPLLKFHYSRRRLIECWPELEANYPPPSSIYKVQIL